MSVLAIKQLVASTLTTNQSSVIAHTQYAKVIVFRQVPKFEKLGSGFFVVLGPWERTEKRMTVPRGQAMKQAVYRLQIMVEGVGKDEQARGDDFDTALENLQSVIRAITTPLANLTDPVTGGTSTLLEIAEEIQARNAEPVPAAAQGLVRFIADIFVSATEVFNA